jgi:hypothetical protein
MVYALINAGNLFLIKLGIAMPTGAYVLLAVTCGHTHNYKQQLLISNGRIWTKWQALGLYMYLIQFNVHFLSF